MTISKRPNCFATHCRDAPAVDKVVTGLIIDE